MLVGDTGAAPDVPEVTQVRASVARRHAPVLAIAAAGVLLRLPYLVAPEGSDEGGYLTVAHQWHAGPSLYGQYWVDRPPLLIALFQLSSALGGLPALRVVGALAAAVAVVGVADACRCVAGRRGALGGAALAAVLFASPQLGTIQVNGELLAAPFIAWSIALTLRALSSETAPSAQEPSRFGPVPAAFGAGACAVGAVLVKQNMAEPFLFGAVAVLVGWRIGALTRAAVRRIATAAIAGAVAALVLVGGWAVLHGTSLTGVFDAMYPFRLRAAALLATMPDLGQTHRAGVFVHAWVASGVLLLVAAFLWAALRRRKGAPLEWAPGVWAPAVWGLSAVLVWASASMVLSGGFWDHYLVEIVVPASIAGGLSLARLRPTRRDMDRPGAALRRRSMLMLSVLAAAFVVVTALVHWADGLSARMSNRGTGIGVAIAAVAAPGDTLISEFGDAETVHASGLRSPYPYLWTLPAQVDDPQLSRLSRLLEGPAAPTWLVSWDRPSFPAPVQARLDAVVAGRYRPVGVVCGHRVLLRNGIERPAPPPEACEGPVAGW